jgi:apolipoprotein N-acyltransferase
MQNWKNRLKIAGCFLGLFLTGAAFPLGFAPLDLWPVSLLSILGLWGFLQSDLGHKRPFLSGWFFGLGVYGLGTSWIFVSIYFFGGVSLALSIGTTIAFSAMLALTSGASAWLYRHLRSSLGAPTRISATKKQRFAAAGADTMIFAASWTLLEWFRTWFFSGFPWLFLGYAGLDSVFAGYIPLFGVLGTSCIMVVLIILPVSAITQRARPAIAITMTTLFTLLGFSLKFWSWTEPNIQDSIDVHMVQGNIPQAQKRNPAFFDQHLDIYKTLTVGLWDKLDAASPEEIKKPHLVIWPEAAIPKLLHIAWETYDEFNERASAENAGWITGVPWAILDSAEPIFHNGIIAAGIGSGFYEKQRLVPFGESLPFPTIAHKLGPLFNLSQYGFSPGAANQSPLTAQGLQISPFICYEIVFPELVRQQAKQADILLTISNDGWFGKSFGPDQHFQMARARALETGKMLLRVTNNGITAIIDERGNTVKELPTFTRAILSGSAYPTIGSTPFMTLGHAPVLTFNFTIVLLCLLRLLSKPRGNTNRQPSQSTGQATEPVFSP